MKIGKRYSHSIYLSFMLSNIK